MHVVSSPTGLCCPTEQGVNSSAISRGVCQPAGKATRQSDTDVGRRRRRRDRRGEARGDGTQRTSRAAGMQRDKNNPQCRAGAGLGHQRCVVTPPLTGAVTCWGVHFSPARAARAGLGCLGSRVRVWCPPLPPTRPRLRDPHVFQRDFSVCRMPNSQPEPKEMPFWPQSFIPLFRTITSSMPWVKQVKIPCHG